MGLVEFESDLLASWEDNGGIGEGIEEEVGADACGDEPDDGSWGWEEIYWEGGKEEFNSKIDQDQEGDPEDGGVGELGAFEEKGFQ